MALAREIMQGGFSAGGADAINGQVKGSISAAGTTISDATALTSSINLVTTVAASSGVLLPNGELGDSVEVFNQGANTLKVYPPTSSQGINALSVGTAVSVATNTAIWFRKVSTTQWIAFLSA